MRVVQVVEPMAYAYPPEMALGYARPMQELVDRAQAALDERVAALPPGLAATGELRQGEPAREIAEASDGADLLVLGSRGSGPLEAVLLGGVSGRVVRSARCPAMVVPRGVRAPVDVPLASLGSSART